MAPRIAVLGCGYWGSNHIRTLNGLGALCAVSDADLARAQSVAAQYGVKALTVDEVINDKNIDALVLALPAQFHAELAIRAIESGKDVLVEKPIALTVSDAEKEVACAKEHERIFMVGHVLRFHPAFEKMLDLIKSGELGEIKYIHSHRLGLGKFHTENDALWDLAPHDLSMILAITGSAPVKTHGEGAATLDHLSDFAHLHMEFEGGVKGHLFASRLNPYRERRLSVVGTKAMAVFDDMEPWAQKLAVYRHRIWNDDNQILFENAEPDYVAIDEGMPLTRELEHFIHCVETREQPRTNGQEAIDVLRILTDGTVQHK